MAASLTKCQCGNPATRLCDCVLGYSIGGWVETTRERAIKAGRESEYVPGKGLPLYGEEMFTCDAPLCSECTTPNGFNSLYHDNNDLCPIHAQSRPKPLAMTAEQAEAIRRRARFVVVG